MAESRRESSAVESAWVLPEIMLGGASVAGLHYRLGRTRAQFILSHGASGHGIGADRVVRGLHFEPGIQSNMDSVLPFAQTALT